MTRNSIALILSGDEARRHDLETIFNFVSEQKVYSGDDAWQVLTAADPELVAGVSVAVVDGDDAHATKAIRAVCAFSNGLPILLIGDPELSGLSEEENERIIARLAWPLNYTKVVDSLYRAHVYCDQHLHLLARGQQRGLELFRSLIGTSRSIQDVRRLMEQVADKDVTVLITGESGTGKEVVARNLHYHSSRRNRPFVPVNCGAIPAELLESELFGHEKGAFPGAITPRVGRLELAEGGTLFLDEISEMSLDMQVKVLRFLQEHTYERVGSNRAQSADVRIITATHQSLENMIEASSFREDLHSRLNIFPIEVPPLRERLEDIPLLINELISRMEQEKRGSLRMNSAAIMSLCRHDWPGNVRELAHLVERLAITNPYGVIGVQELPKKFRYVDDIDENRSSEEFTMPSGAPGLSELDAPALLPVNGIDLKAYLASLEKQLIQQALNETEGVVARAAEKLCIRRTTLVEKVRKYGLRQDEAEQSQATK